jgi:glycosyltransferase involved in cell wall biosynthesis
VKILFVHQNFPGQFPHLSQALKARGHEVMALTVESNQRASPVPVLKYRFTAPEIDRTVTRMGTTYTEMVRRGEVVARACLQMRDKGVFQPDVVFSHLGWGEGLFLRPIWPAARFLTYAEFFYRPSGADTGFDAEFSRPDAIADGSVLARTGHLLLAMQQADEALAPTNWQASVFPDELKPKIRVIHDGINTEVASPKPGEVLTLPDGTVLSESDEVISFVARNLEPYRGYHIFMRALPDVLARRPKAHVVIVGAEGVSYGQKAPEGQSWKEIFLAPVRDKLDLSRVHFTGRLPYEDLIRLFRITRAHAYLSYPFVLSWSMLEAMSCGALVVGSDTPPVAEVIQHGENGVLVDFFDIKGWADALTLALAEPERYRAQKVAARETVLRDYDLKSVCLPKLIDFVELP